ncbi:phosphotransferase 1 [Peziza echinospora]|nr:phosphotransferase 1 [Peziza echinospora]
MSSSRGRGRGGRRDGGRGGGRGGEGGQTQEQVTISRALSYTLRHGALKEGLNLRPDGYANVAELLRMHKFQKLGLDFDTLQKLVRDSDKQRFMLASIGETGEPVPIQFKAQLSTTTTTAGDEPAVATITQTLDTVDLNPKIDSTDPASYLIRAAQGHSIPISSTALQLKAITQETIPPVCIHGTFYPFFEPILATGGLKPMGRNHIHFAAGLPASHKDGSPAVISGMRRDAQLLFYIDIASAMAAGIPFWRSENNVILSEGDVSKGGILGMDHVEKVVDCGRSDLGVIWERGRGVVRELPAALKNKGIPRGKEKVVKHMNRRGGKGGPRDAEAGEPSVAVHEP